MEQPAMPESRADRVFRGPGYSADLDRKRLSTQIERLRMYMLGAGWRTVTEIRSALEEKFAPTIFPENSIAAQLRNLRKSPYCYKLEKRRRGRDHAAHCAGIWEFHLVTPAESVNG